MCHKNKTTDYKNVHAEQGCQVTCNKFIASSLIKEEGINIILKGVLKHEKK